MSQNGFTSAELAAAEWSRLWKQKLEEHTGTQGRRKERGRPSHVEDDRKWQRGDMDERRHRHGKSQRRIKSGSPCKYPEDDEIKREPRSSDDEHKTEIETQRTKRVAELRKEIQAEAQGNHQNENEEEADTPPADPRNPLFAAYERPQGRRGVQRRPRRRDSDAGDCWTHDRFRNRSLSPDRPDPQEVPLYDTRAGSWRARAGGVYLPPVEAEVKSQEEEEAPPSKRRRFWDSQI
eukprot:Gregarina_sp_Poly_1__3063@NODE_1860_length_3187_cov_79_407372_g1205_i0_p2_GENE_NODE_1860_length_3187_cov_79_407372_g1205_i0NODE_1860_length_3187_cov_79_407372_g1205_i0_p2_ORF_typecomplete_len235_score42_43_NODE_1860_length_3187_cov_79_407372_g1205_i015862290